MGPKEGQARRPAPTGLGGVMPYDRDVHHRRSIRLPGYDYARAGAYFVTICAQNRECLFGEITDSEMRPNNAGRMVQVVVAELPLHFHGVATPAFVLMPNHPNMIINLEAPILGDPGVPEFGRAGTSLSLRLSPQVPEQGRAAAVPEIVAALKSITTTRYRVGVPEQGWPAFPGKLWQRNYYEHIIRDDGELHAVHQYILDNPLRWDEDEENPHAPGTP